jgi:hypothetical protein
MKIHRIILLGAAALLISCAGNQTVGTLIPRSAGTDIGNIPVDSETSVTASSRMVPQRNGSWETGPEGIRIEVIGPRTGRRVGNVR